VLGSVERAFAARTLVDVLADTAERHPDALAIDDGHVALTYRDLLERVGTAAGRLAELARPPVFTAAACPFPDESAVSRPGAEAANGAVAANVMRLWYWTLTLAFCPETPYGTIAVTWLDEAYSTGAKMPLNVTLTPPNCVPTKPVVGCACTGCTGPRPAP